MGHDDIVEFYEDGNNRIIINKDGVKEIKFYKSGAEKAIVNNKYLKNEEFER